MTNLGEAHPCRKKGFPPNRVNLRQVHPNDVLVATDAVQETDDQFCCSRQALGVAGAVQREATEPLLEAPAVRTLLQVEVGDTEDAEGVFSTLMGDVVEPRRDFIVGNALKVANLDV